MLADQTLHFISGMPCSGNALLATILESPLFAGWRCVRPFVANAFVYDSIGLSRFAHDFELAEYDMPVFDLQLGMPGMHRVKPKVAFTERRTGIRPDLFQKYAEMTFLIDPRGSAANVIAHNPNLKDTAV